MPRRAIGGSVGNAIAALGNSRRRAALEIQDNP